jgi:hypothetical protein
MAARAVGRAGDGGHVSPLSRRPLALGPLAAALAARTSAAARCWLAQAQAQVRRDSGALAALFPAVGRAVGRGPLHPCALAEDVHAWTVDAAARTVLLAALGPAVDAHLAPLYRHGDAAERRAVLLALAFLPVADAVGVPLVEDALRLNDPRLVAAALGPYALARLDDAALAQAVLKCLFVGVPLAGVAGVQERATLVLAAALDRYVAEREAAGRAVPAEVWPLVRAGRETETVGTGSPGARAGSEGARAAAGPDERSTTEAEC